MKCEMSVFKMNFLEMKVLTRAMLDCCTELHKDQKSKFKQLLLIMCLF